MTTSPSTTSKPQTSNRRGRSLKDGVSNAERRAMLAIGAPVTVAFSYAGSSPTIQVPATVTALGSAEHLVTVTLDDYDTTFTAHVRSLSDVGPKPRFLAYTHGAEPTREDVR